MHPVITHCPICRYSLEGLPDKHRCPECGFEYEKDSILFPAPRRGWAVAMLTNLIAAGVFAAIMLIKGPWMGGFLIFAFLFAAAIHYYRYRRDAGTAVLLSDDRVREIRNGVVVKTVHLGGIDRANWSFVDGGLRLYREGQELERVRTVANRAVARAIQARLTKRKQLVCPDVPPQSTIDT